MNILSYFLRNLTIAVVIYSTTVKSDYSFFFTHWHNMILEETNNPNKFLSRRV